MFFSNWKNTQDSKACFLLRLILTGPESWPGDGCHLVAKSNNLLLELRSLTAAPTEGSLPTQQPWIPSLPTNKDKVFKNFNWKDIKELHSSISLGRIWSRREEGQMWASFPSSPKEPPVSWFNKLEEPKLRGITSNPSLPSPTEGLSLTSSFSAYMLYLQISHHFFP